MKNPLFEQKKGLAAIALTTMLAMGATACAGEVSNNGVPTTVPGVETTLPGTNGSDKTTTTEANSEYSQVKEPGYLSEQELVDWVFFDNIDYDWFDLEKSPRLEEDADPVVAIAWYVRELNIAVGQWNVEALSALYAFGNTETPVINLMQEIEKQENAGVSRVQWLNQVSFLVDFDPSSVIDVTPPRGETFTIHRTTDDGDQLRTTVYNSGDGYRVVEYDFNQPGGAWDKYTTIYRIEAGSMVVYERFEGHFQQ